MGIFFGNVIPFGSGHSSRCVSCRPLSCADHFLGSRLILQKTPSSVLLPCCDRLFNSAEECARLWNQLGCDYNVVQVSPGPLQGRLRVDHQDGILLVSMQADQALLVEGTRHPRWLSFTLEHTENFHNHRHFGESLAPNVLAGFNTQMKETLMRTSPGGNRIGAVLVDRRRAETWTQLLGASDVVDRIEHNNTAILSSTMHRRLRQLMLLPVWQGADVPHPFQADLLEAQLVESLSPESTTLLQPVFKTHHSDLVQELVRFSFQSSTEPISLSSVCQALFTTKTTLTVSCREMFGYGPMALMRRIRLQQVHELLSNPDLQQRLGCHTVQRAAEHFGFVSRNHFASAYRDLFAETPRTTLLASR